ncbi:MAG: 50S ribosomal protein L10 [Pelolinea sp.]|nr:50S ribosomal protein L10 [Pelolinea sp.]
MAFTKEEKKELVATYEKWLKESKAAYVLSYTKMAMKDIDALRSEAREFGGELHVVKNTLMNLALKNCGLEDVGLFDKSSLVAFAFNDAASMAKVVDKASSSEQYDIKGGYLDGAPLNAASVQLLAKLPALPQMRAQLLALIQTPATQLVRTLMEPARKVAAVIKAYSEKSPAQAVG